eukprot:TRINITY_DN2009_c0_g1_i1.p1 TRINITY_DN2009_c0_g1~~TRINITY_DN2009_c0_g1_i1.p1  ORF type:complete len:1053 (-),score=358.53 TRINITY_DN2009_c0_g1_i1:41-3163(-)
MASKSQKFNSVDALKEKRRKFVKAKLPKKPNPQSDEPIVQTTPESEALYSPLSAWYESMERLKHIKPLDDTAKVDPKIMVQLKEQARILYEERVKKFDRETEGEGDTEWLRTVLKSGTVTDKMAAMTIRLQRYSFYRLKTLDLMMSLARKKGRRESQMAIETLKDLFLNNLLPSERKLTAFNRRPLTDKAVTDDHLIFWYYEDAVKTRYAEYLRLLELGSHDALLHFKEKVVKAAFELLLEKPEGEQILLAILINKLGDKERKLSSKVVYLMNLLLMKHPQMKLVIAKEVETFLHRPNIPPKAQYYAVIFLNQMVLNKTSVEVSRKLINIYFSMFKVFVEHKGDVESKMLSALLTGVNRAFPFATLDAKAFEDQMDMLFRLVHVATFNKAVQALLLIYQVMSAQDFITDRFYRALYDILLHRDLFKSSKQTMFLNVLYKTLKNDNNLARTVAIVKRLLQVCLIQKAPFVCGTLFLLSEVIKIKPELKQFVSNAPTDSEEFTKYAQAVLDFIEGEYKKENPDAVFCDEKILAAASAANNNENGDEEENENNEENDGSDSSEEAEMNGDLDGEKKTKHIIPKDSIELLHEAQAKQKEEEASHNEENSEKEDGSTKKPQVPHFNDEYLSSMDWTKVGKLPLSSYDAIKREPRFVNSEASCFYELNALGQHIHPSVAKFANYLLAGEDVLYEGDPITDFSLTSFLDRFSYKKPKKEPKVGSGSAMQPTHIRRVDIEHPVNSQEFLNQKEHEISEQDTFFYQYFKMKQHSDPEASNKKKQKKKKNDEEEDSDAEEVEGEEEAEEDIEVQGGDEDIGSFEEVDDDEADVFLKNQMGVLEEAGDEDIADLEDNGDSFEGDFDYDDLDNASFDEDSDEIADPSDKHLEKVLAAEYSDDETGDNIDLAAADEDEGDKEGEMDDEFDDDDDDDGIMGELLEDDLMDGDDDDDDDDDEEEDDQMSNRQRKKLQQRGGIKLKTGSTFASADEFAELLLSGENNNNKQSAWEEGNWRKKSNFSGQKRKAGGGGGGKKGSAGGRKGGNKRQRRG